MKKKIHPPTHQKSMGCVSSKLLKKQFEANNKNGGSSDFTNHIVSLTSSTYGVLKLENKDYNFQQTPLQIIKECVKEVKNSPPHEVINTWELMEGLDDNQVDQIHAKVSPKSRVFLRGIDSPLKFLNHMSSPRKLKKFGGKENKEKKFSPKSFLKENSPLKVSPRVKISKEENVNGSKCDSLRVDSIVVSSRRRSLSPLFDPQLVAASEKEEIKKMVSVTPISRKARKSQDSETMLGLFEKKCPPGGENAVVIYTTTLRGIRKTFEDCNTARAILESNGVQMIERDISMDSGYKEELRGLMGKKEVKVPLVFVKGRLIGGANEMVKLEEEGNLGILLDGIPSAVGVAACPGCAGIRFIMCMDCNGSRKLLAKDGKNTIKCGECNENGLIQCPICC